MSILRTDTGNQAGADGGEPKMTELPYVVECRSNGRFFETIAAFNCKSAAREYVRVCKRVNKIFDYRMIDLTKKKAA